MFSSSILSILHSFADTVGVPFEPAADGSVSYSFSESGTISFTPARNGDALVISRSRTLQTQERTDLTALASQSAYVAELQSDLFVGLTPQGDVYFSTVLFAQEISLPKVEAAIDQLIKK
ncbi:CesT family type III secretion system chaperone [Polycladidibacter hongkongensis]|uniref:CesT family type III secretion system chaperone n=1 Tax=Polycladidibacter hongkongensis TaxID=1647556 RepID=UPI00082D2AF6|nr:CesT family type III secretion system chaperone [Pseudovibrio hongkongensis]